MFIGLKCFVRSTGIISCLDWFQAIIPWIIRFTGRKGGGKGAREGNGNSGREGVRGGKREEQREVGKGIEGRKGRE